MHTGNAECALNLHWHIQVLKGPSPMEVAFDLLAFGFLLSTEMDGLMRPALVYYLAY
jgi:hypothetical protein